MPGYVNVDFMEPADQLVDLSQLPWPWKDGEAEEVQMLDFLEHFPYRMTNFILGECWRILQPGGKLVIQVPDFSHCARAAMVLPPFMCNRCPTLFDESVRGLCHGCGAKVNDISEAAIHRLYGGQDRKGNWHFNAFTKASLELMLIDSGFCDAQFMEYNENGETYFQNWNFKVQATKNADGWGE